MTINIRAARSEELSAIQAIEAASGLRFVGLMDAIANDAPTSLELLAARQAAGQLLVAETDASGAPTLAGFAMFRPLEKSLYIEQVDVLPAFERQRIGATLINAVASQARAIGLLGLTLSTFRAIPWNAPYYRRLGFADIEDSALTPDLTAIRREHQARGLDESARVFMARTL